MSVVKYSTLLPWLMVFGAGLCLRTGISSLAPVLGAIQEQLLIAGGALGLLTAVPVICMGLLSPLGYIAYRQFGLKRAMLLAFGILILGLSLRLAAQSYGVLLLTAALVGIGDAIIRPLLSGFIKETFHDDKAPAAMGLYATSMGVGSAIAAYATPLLANMAGGWQAGLAFWALPAVAAAGLWAVWPAARGAVALPAVVTHRPKRRVVVWLALFFGLQAGINYTVVAWLPSLYMASGFTPHASSALIALFLALQTATSLFFPLLLRGARVGVVGAMGIFTALVIAGTLMLWWLPQTVWGAAALLGLGTGGLFPLALLLPLAFSASKHEATRLSGLTQSAGYLFGGMMPWIAGAAADGFGVVSGVAVLALLMGLGLIAVVVLVRASYRENKTALQAGP
ncbi:CP family cyanate transporter-like MFS transporter [Gibbsiella quercinecans]|nr:CP family cyanate transporter-like MFS transporter [Gibbsiella quercinecans]